MEDRDTESGTHQWEAVVMGTIPVNAADIMAPGKLSVILRRPSLSSPVAQGYPFECTWATPGLKSPFIVIFFIKHLTLFFQVYKANWGHQSSYELKKKRKASPSFLDHGIMILTFLSKLFHSFQAVSAFCVLLIKIECPLKAIPASCDAVIKIISALNTSFPSCQLWDHCWMNHWRNETLSKMFFFLIAGLRFIRLRDKGKLIKYVDVWSLFFFLSLLSKFWNATVWLYFPVCGSLWARRSWWERLMA